MKGWNWKWKEGEGGRREEGGYIEGRRREKEEGGKVKIEKTGWIWEEMESELPDARLLIFCCRSSDRPLGEGEEGWM